jgi:hypothetical protein
MMLRDKSRFRAAFAALYGNVYIQVQGTLEERADAVANLLDMCWNDLCMHMHFVLLHALC